MRYHEDLSIRAALIWEASGFERMPSPEELLARNLTWESQIVKTYETIKWARNALAENHEPKEEKN